MKSLKSSLLVCGTMLFMTPLFLKAQEVKPSLSSSFSCGCLNSKEEKAPFDVGLTSSVEKGTNEFIYKYEFRNNSQIEVKLLILMSSRDRVSFVGEFITDSEKPPGYRFVRGSIFINLKPNEKKTFTVRDNASSFVAVSAQMFLIDKYDSKYAGGGVSIYFPLWEHIFGQ